MLFLPKAPKDRQAVPRESRVLKVKEVDPKEKLKEEPRGQAVKVKRVSSVQFSPCWSFRCEGPNMHAPQKNHWNDYKPSTRTYNYVQYYSLVCL